VINIFKACKSAGADEIVPALLQQGTEHLVAHLGHIFGASLAGGYIPDACRQVKATFIPKPRKANTIYTKAKAYHLLKQCGGCHTALYSMLHVKYHKRMINFRMRMTGDEGCE